MDNITQNFNTLLKTVLKSKSDREFYQQAYNYLDLVKTNKDLRQILEQSEVEYNSTKQRLIKQNLYSTCFNKKIDKTLSLNLYDISFQLYLDIYDPINSFKNDPEDETDPVGIVLMKGTNYKTKKTIWGKNYLKDYKKEWNKKIPDHKKQLKVFHSRLLIELSKDNNSNLKTIFISDKDGIYIEEKGKKLKYPIGLGSKRMKLIKYLDKNDIVIISKLERILKQDKSVIMTAIRKINENFRKNLKLKNNLIIHNDTDGYSLNKKKFDPVLIK